MKEMNRGRLFFIILPVLIVLLSVLSLLYGAVSIPYESIFKMLSGGEVENESWRVILFESRIPQTVTALLSGAALAVSGLLLQTLFRNPLAGPSILGISDGANLGVAVVMLFTGGSIWGIGGYVAVVVAALAGALSVLAIILSFSRVVRSNMLLLIIGIMVGYMVSSFISILNFYASADKVQQFVMWGMGDFSSVSLEKLPFFSLSLIVALFSTLLLIKPLNALLLGENYAVNLGVNVKRIRFMIFLSSGLLVAVVTAFCGPISFIGIAVPHIARMLMGTSNHQRLLPVTMLVGSCVTLLCNILTILPGGGSLLPLNAVTPIIGAPVIIYVIAGKKNIRLYN